MNVFYIQGSHKVLQNVFIYLFTETGRLFVRKRPKQLALVTKEKLWVTWLGAVN